MFKKILLSVVALAAITGVALFGSTDSALAHECDPHRTHQSIAAEELWAKDVPGPIVWAMQGVIRAENAWMYTPISPFGASEVSIIVGDHITPNRYVQAGFINIPGVAGPILFLQTNGGPGGPVTTKFAGYFGVPASPVGIVESYNYNIEVAFNYPTDFYQIKINGQVWTTGYVGSIPGTYGAPFRLMNLNAGITHSKANQVMGTAGASNRAYVVAAIWYDSLNWGNFSGDQYTEEANFPGDYVSPLGSNWMYVWDNSPYCNF